MLSSLIESMTTNGERNLSRQNYRLSILQTSGSKPLSDEKTTTESELEVIRIKEPSVLSKLLMKARTRRGAKDQKLLKNLEEIEGPAKSNDLNSTNRNLVEHKGTKKLKRPQNHVTPHTSIIPHEKGKDHRP